MGPTRHRDKALIKLDIKAMINLNDRDLIINDALQERSRSDKVGVLSAVTLRARRQRGKPWWRWLMAKMAS